MSGVQEEQVQVGDLDEYQEARFHAAREAGLTRVEAYRFAVGLEPLHLLWRLRTAGCSPALIAQIVI